MKSLATAAKKKFSKEEEFSQEYKPNFRILVVDDEKEILSSYQDILGESDTTDKVVPIRSSRAKKTQSSSAIAASEQVFEIVAVSSYGEALSAVESAISMGEPFAMGFFDVMLGEGPDGFDLVKKIHEIDSKMYAVFVTAYNDRSIDSIQDFLGKDNTQRWDYLNKPFSHGEILQKARNFVRLYNLTEEKSIREIQMEEVRRLLVESEKTSSVAAVARGVSHEFGNLLMQIMGKADLCLTNGESEKMKEGLEVILEATGRANDILEKFKSLSNPHSEQAVKEYVSLNDVLSEALSLMEHKIRTAELKISMIKTDPVVVVGYKTSLLQVVVNLTINAIHAMGDSGQIDYTLADLGQEVEFRVRDYGPGMNEVELEKALEPFFTTKGSQGTGLGLPICQEIIEVDHLGTFRVQNHGVKGLEVIMRIPKAGGEQ